MTLDLPLIWAGLIAVAVLLYVVLDGFDLGLGILFPFARSPQDRDVMMNTVAPVWDGNETWLVLGGGGLLAAFPLAYSILMPALYLPVLMMLAGQTVQARGEILGLLRGGGGGECRQGGGDQRLAEHHGRDCRASSHERQGPKRVGHRRHHGESGDGQHREPHQPLPQGRQRIVWAGRGDRTNDSRSPESSCRGTPNRPRRCRPGWWAGSPPCPTASGPGRCPAPRPDGSSPHRAPHRARN